MKNHSCNLHSPLCGIFHPNSVAVARYGALIRAKSPTNYDAHLAESLLKHALKCNTIITFSSLLFNKKSCLILLKQDFCASRSMLLVTERTVTDFFQSRLFCAKAALPDRLIMFYFALAAFLSPRKPIDVTQISLSKIINMAGKINSTTTILMIAPRASSVQIEPIISTCE